MLRQYLPNGTDLSGYTQQELDAIADNRPFLFDIEQEEDARPRIDVERAAR